MIRKNDSRASGIATTKKCLQRKCKVFRFHGEATAKCNGDEMKIPVITGTIRRRFLINFRVRLDAMRHVLPSPFEPKPHRGWGIAGICLIRLEGIHPKATPLPCGINSENAAHRFAVQWNEDGVSQIGVFIPRRDTDSLLNHIAGGRVFPGVHHRARFKVLQNGNSYDFGMSSSDNEVSVSFSGHKRTDFPMTSIFASLNEASTFFEEGSLGYSSAAESTHYDGLLLRTEKWQVTPFHVESVHSSYFSNESRFPEGSVEFDHALLMENIPHEWHTAEELCCKEAV